MAPSSSGLPAPLTKRKRVILSSAILSVLLVPVGIGANFRFDIVAGNDVFSVGAMVAVCVAPFLGIVALRMATQELEGIRKGIIPISVRRAAAWGKTLGIAGSAANGLFLLMFLVQASSYDSAAAARDVMIGDLNTILAHANKYRVESAKRGGGGGAYGGYAIPTPLAENAKGIYAAAVVHKDTLRLIATWRGDSASTITVELGPDGRLIGNVAFAGAFKE